MKVPTFRDEQEEAAFWETHSPLDYPDHWAESGETRAQRPLGHILAVRLDAQTIGRLAALARRKGIGPSTLARMWILERLTELQDAEGNKQVSANREP